MLLRNAVQQSNRAQATLRIRCPGCRDRVTLESISGQDADPSFQSEGQTYIAALRVCANPDCRSLIFCLYFADGYGGAQVSTVFPAETVDFDASGLPAAVLAAFDEAVICHAHECYVAAAIMIRKSLEEVCRDRQADGGNLMQKIAALREKVILPPALLDSLDALRLLGNDAAHLESRVYEQVGREEVEVGLAVTKEILKSIYQLDSIAERLNALRRRADT